MSLQTLQIVAPCFIIGSGLAFIFLERLFPYNKNQKVFRDGFWVDLIGYGLVQSYLLTLIISSLIYYIDHHTGISRLRLVSDWPIWVQVIFFIVWHDLNTYLIHRLQHKVPSLWRIHEAHHACKQVDWLAGIRSHSLEILLNQTIEFLPVVLLGASPEVPLYKGMANAVYGMFIHANLNVTLGKFIYVFNGPELHRWHHASDELEAIDKNFATKFSIWDWAFKSVYDPRGKKAHIYGPSDDLFPKGYIAQHLYAFRPFPKSAEQS